MREIMKRTVAAVMAVLIACAAAGCSSTGNSSSGSSSAGETTTTTAPVVEDMGNIDLSDVTTEYDVPEDFSYESEAEKGTLSGGAAVLDKNFLGKFSGDGFVSVGSSGDMVEFEIDFPAKGSYNITLTMAADGEGQSNLITVDGAALTNFTSTTTEFGGTMAENVLIDEGSHKVGIKGDNGHIYIDKIKITPAPAIDLSQYEVSNQLSNPNASDEAKRLYNFLTDVYGKYTISGQFSGDNEGKDCREFKEIKKHTGKTPAILGLDVSNLSNSALSHGAGGGDMVPLQAMDWYNNENGIVSLCWHWYAPEKNLDSPTRVPTCRRPRLSRLSVLAVIFCQTVERMSPLITPHSTSLVVGTRTPFRSSTILSCVSVLVLDPVERMVASVFNSEELTETFLISSSTP